MAQRIRKARPGTWHHVYNRGIGKRVVFATRADYLRFQWNTGLSPATVLVPTMSTATWDLTVDLGIAHHARPIRGDVVLKPPT